MVHENYHGVQFIKVTFHEGAYLALHLLDTAPDLRNTRDSRVGLERNRYLLDGRQSLRHLGVLLLPHMIFQLC